MANKLIEQLELEVQGAETQYERASNKVNEAQRERTVAARLLSERRAALSAAFDAIDLGREAAQDLHDAIMRDEV